VLGTPPALRATTAAGGGGSGGVKMPFEILILAAFRDVITLTIKTTGRNEYHSTPLYKRG
jgi:hypothetical protein